MKNNRVVRHKYIRSREKGLNFLSNLLLSSPHLMSVRSFLALINDIIYLDTEAKNKGRRLDNRISVIN